MTRTNLVGWIIGAVGAIVALCAVALPCYALELSVVPKSSTVDQPLEITVRAQPNAVVTTKFTMQRFGLTFSSEATFKVPASGIVRLSRQAPISGSYRGTSAMGLFWSAVPTSAKPKPYQFTRDSELAPRPYTISASSGGKTVVTNGARIVQAANVVRQVVDSTGMVATLFRPTGSNCRPGVIVLSGSEGGVPEEQAAVLASHDLTTLALAYFQAPGLPSSLTEIPIEVVQRALTFMREQPLVCPHEAALFGGSKGAELALLSASTFDGVRSVVALKPSSVVFLGLFGKSDNVSSWSYGGKPVPFANGAVPAAVKQAISAKENAHEKTAYVDDYLARLQNNTDPAAVIQVERIAAPILLVAGGSDHLWPSVLMAQQIMQRRQSMAQRFADQLLVYPGAGHLIGIPFQFAKAEMAHSFLDVGGSPEADEAADEQSWPIIVQFLQRP
jgi:dienelactone hydrolase